MSEIDYSSVRPMPAVKPNAETQRTTATTIPASTSLQDISAHSHKFNWNKDPLLMNLPESSLTTKNATIDRHKTVSQSNDRIFEHPEIIIKPSTLNDEIHRRLIIATKTFPTNENGSGSAPNILEHPDIKAPIVMDNHQLSLSSSSASSTSNNKKKLTRQQSADVYATRTRTASPINRDTNQNNYTKNLQQSNSPGSVVSDISDRHEQEKSDDTSSSSAPLPTTTRNPIKIIREYAETSSTSDVDLANKHSNNNNNKNPKPQSEEDDFW